MSGEAVVEVGDPHEVHGAAGGEVGIRQDELVVLFHGSRPCTLLAVEESEATAHAYGGIARQGIRLGDLGDVGGGVGGSEGLTSSTSLGNNRKSRKGSVITNRGIRADILGDSSRLADSVVHNIPENACRGGLLGVLAGTAGELQLMRLFVLLGIQHVGALQAEAEGDLLEVFARVLIGG